MLKNSLGGLRNVAAAQASFPGLQVSTVSSHSPPACLETHRWQSRASPDKKKQQNVYKIVFYEGKCFTGRKLEICSDCDNFQDRGFMNRVNSVRVESGAFICFDHPDFKGQQYILEHGEYPEFQRWNAHNDHMGSCRPIRMHGEHYRMELFEGDNFTSQCVELCDDCPFLQARGLTKSCVNSIKVYGDGAWVLYEEPNYRGRMYIVERGNYCTHMEWQAENPNIQSVRRVANYF